LEHLVTVWRLETRDRQRQNESLVIDAGAGEKAADGRHVSAVQAVTRATGILRCKCGYIRVVPCLMSYNYESSLTASARAAVENEVGVGNTQARKTPNLMSVEFEGVTPNEGAK